MFFPEQPCMKHLQVTLLPLDRTPVHHKATNSILLGFHNGFFRHSFVNLGGEKNGCKVSFHMKQKNSTVVLHPKLQRKE